ncbi:MAG: flavodoxin domain-containing protein [Promethearchaeota archaeon]
MIRVLVAYDTKYGNTRRLAEIITQGLREVQGVEVSITNMKEFDFNKAEGFNAIIMGSPNHFGGPTRTLPCSKDAQTNSM